MALYKCGGDTKYRKLYEQEVSAYNTLNNNYNTLNNKYNALYLTYGDLTNKLLNGSIRLGFTNGSVYTKTLSIYPIWMSVDSAVDGSIKYIDPYGNTNAVSLTVGNGDSYIKLCPTNPNNTLAPRSYLNPLRLQIISVSWIDKNAGTATDGNTGYSYFLYN